jgi:hypothetical protein
MEWAAVYSEQARLIFVSLPTIAAQLSREQAGRLLAPLCKAGRDFVREVDKREDAGLKPGWRWGAWPLFEVQRTRARIRRLYGASDIGLSRVLESLATALHELHFTTSPEDTAFEYVFDRQAACDGVQPSVLGVHRLRVRDNTEFVSRMNSWARLTGYERWAVATMHRYGRDRGARTQVVLRLLKVLGLIPARGRGLKAPPDSSVHAVHAQHLDPLWHAEFIATTVSKRGWVA